MCMDAAVCRRAIFWIHVAALQTYTTNICMLQPCVSLVEVFPMQESTQACKCRRARFWTLHRSAMVHMHVAGAYTNMCIDVAVCRRVLFWITATALQTYALYSCLYHWLKYSTFLCCNARMHVAAEYTSMGMDAAVILLHESDSQITTTNNTHCCNMHTLLHSCTLHTLVTQLHKHGILQHLCINSDMCILMHSMVH
jgi:hypothetical protein